MNVQGAAPWYRRPVPTLLAGIALLAVCAVCAVLWISESQPAARPAGLVTGATGIFLVYGAVTSLRESRSARP
jgi:hypothetical protein